MAVVETVTIWTANDIHCTKEGNTDYTAANANSIPLYEAFRDLANAAAPDAVVSIGDLADTPTSLDDAAGIVATINNHHAVLGNHDVAVVGIHRADYWKTVVPDAYGMPAPYYAFDVGFCRCVVLDTNFDADGTDSPAGAGYIPAAQLVWLQSQLNRAPATLVFVHHHPQNRFTADGFSWFVPENLHYLWHILQQGRNVHVFSGHRHVGSNVELSLSSGSAWLLACLVDRDAGTGTKYNVITASLHDTGAVTVEVESHAITL